VSFAAIALCVASQRVFVVVVVVVDVVVVAAAAHFFIDSVRKLLNTPSYILPKLEKINSILQIETEFVSRAHW
jgi:hypothetical protein